MLAKPVTTKDKAVALGVSYFVGVLIGAAFKAYWKHRK